MLFLGVLSGVFGRKRGVLCTGSASLVAFAAFGLRLDADEAVARAYDGGDIVLSLTSRTCYTCI